MAAGVAWSQGLLLKGAGMDLQKAGSNSPDKAVRSKECSRPSRPRVPGGCWQAHRTLMSRGWASLVASGGSQLSSTGRTDGNVHGLGTQQSL